MMGLFPFGKRLKQMNISVLFPLLVLMGAGAATVAGHMNTSLMMPLLVLVGTGVTIAFDSSMHGRYRHGFANGVALQGSALSLMFFWFSGYSYNHPETPNTFIMLSLYLVMLVGKLIINKSNIADQQAGRMSKWGSWWDTFDDNYFFNIWSSRITYLYIFLFVGALIFNTMGSRTLADSTQPSSPARVAQAKPAITAAHKHTGHNHTGHTYKHLHTPASAHASRALGTAPSLSALADVSCPRANDTAAE
jgi:hypothetical protein